MKFFIPLVALFLVSCVPEPDQRGTATSGTIQFREICIKGVVYYLYGAGTTAALATAWNTSGHLKLCPID